ncbi:MAG: hypothetical protein AAFS10_05085, partial [Myxococcota bacterium]
RSPEPPEDPFEARRRAEGQRSVEFGTHPLAIISVVAGIAALISTVSCCLAPILAPMLQGICGLLAFSCGATVWYWVRVGRVDRSSNLHQARVGTVLGAFGLILAGVWLTMIGVYGPGLGVVLEQPSNTPGLQRPSGP